ncbi:histone acetyltransferase hpa2 [Fusarium austroafricanum]|uniref:Histone acetyltransferase hpa2 n=1 Tax=Fusarium austroafricanum TaxID=2364996 RepID=A0A8H4JV65_9HYPO|nr:histone acetyltransferase hpa2 [Fusarium austroafricanum]
MSQATYHIEKPVREDFEQWSKIFHAYIEFYKSKIDEDQYARTFDRIIEQKNGLQALVVRQVKGDEKTLVGIAHFFPEQTPWNEKQILLLNDLFIDPSIRGQGLGRKLTQAVADVGKEMGCFRLQWVTKHDNITARKLYDTMAETQFVQYRMNLQ